MFSLKIENFRSFKKQKFNFSKINILIGENSSGKSSLLKLLLALKQTIQTPTNRETLLALTGELVDLGNYKENIYYHNESLPLKLEFSFNKSYYNFYENFFSVNSPSKREANRQVQKIRALLNGPINTLTKLNLRFVKELDSHENIVFSISNSKIGNLEISFILKGKQTSHEIYYGKICKIKFNDYYLKEEYELDDISYEKDGFLSIISSISLRDELRKKLGLTDKISSNKQIPKEKEAKFQVLFYKIAFLLITQNYLKNLLQTIEYINPINTSPSRIYLDKDNRQNKEISGIEDVVNYFSRNNADSKKQLIKFVEILKNMGIVDGLEILKDNRLPVKELRVKIKDLVSNILDVGYGVSLQLPTILKALLSEQKENFISTIFLIEQPEVHLHPKLHAKLIESLVNLSTKTVYFIETHSEHIVRKLQVLAKSENSTLRPDEVTIHYFIRENKESVISIHKIDKHGHLTPKFPTGFFDNSYLLSKELLK